MVPSSEITTGNYYQTEDDFYTAIVAIYDQLQDYSNSYSTIYTEYRSDNLTYYLYEPYNIANNTPALADGVIDEMWESLYNLIFRTNIVINRIVDIEIDEDTKSRFIAEAKFFRGFAYYNLARFFGGVPIFLTEPTVEEAKNTARSTDEATYAQAASDFLAAIDGLPETVASSEYGRVTKYAAEGMLANLYIFTSGVTIGQDNWSKAKPLLEDILNNSPYSFADDFESIFSLDGEKGCEVIFSCIFSTEDYGSDFGQYFTKSRSTSLADGYFTFENGLYESFEDGDIRRDASISKEYWDFVTSSWQVGDNNTKWDYGRIEETRNVTVDVIFLRYTEIKLFYAEVLAHLNGITQAALDPVNDVRQRAGLSVLTLGDVPDLNTFIDIILKERRSEFVWEGQRWFDLVRSGKMVDALKSCGHTDADEDWALYPLPIAEINKTNGVLTQNSGY